MKREISTIKNLKIGLQDIMSKRAPRCKIYILSFKADCDWKKIFESVNEEEQKIKMIQWLPNNDWKMILRDSRSEAVTKEIYHPYTTKIYPTFDRTDHVSIVDPAKPLFIYPKPCYDLH